MSARITKLSAKTVPADLALDDLMSLHSADVKAAQAALRDALLTGQDTAEIRAELSKLEDAGEAIERRQAELDAERERLTEAELATATARIAEEAARRIMDLRARLAAPAAPATAS